MLIKMDKATKWEVKKTEKEKSKNEPVCIYLWSMNTLL